MTIRHASSWGFLAGAMLLAVAPGQAAIGLGPDLQGLDLASPTVCDNIPPSRFHVPTELMALCGPATKTSGMHPKAQTDFAFGQNSVTGNLEDMQLNNPGTLNPIGPFTGDGSFIGAGEFDDTGTFTDYYALDSSGELFRVDATTGAATLVGTATAFGTETFTGMATDPTSGVVYAVSCDIANTSLFTLDLQTAAATRIGAIPGSACMIGIGFSNGGTLYGYDLVTDDLWSIDKNTGAGTSIGPLGFSVNFGQGMDFDEDTNTCYLFAFNAGTFQAELRTCDVNTGNTTLVGVMGDVSPGGLNQWGGGAVASGGQPSAVPTLPVWGMVVIFLALAGVAGRYLRT